jgi:hypothetical protein
VAALMGSPGNTGLSSSNKTSLPAYNGVGRITATTNHVDISMKYDRKENPYYIYYTVLSA